MKKILFAMAVLAALASCQKADLAEQNSVNTNGERVITAYFDNAGTKTTLDGVTPKWEPNDEIMLLNGLTHDKITLGESNISADGKSITFTTTLSGPLYAVYPLDATDADRIVTENIVPVTLKAEQDGTFGSANICVAKEDDGKLAFKNVTSVLHLTQTASTGVNEIIITTPSADIAGTGTVNMSATTPALELISGKSKKIKVKSASVKSEYYIAVAPTILPEGTAFGFATGSELGGTNLSEEKTIAANTIYNIGSMDALEIEPNKYHEYVEINGLKWATMNIGATNATENGKYFMWGEITGLTSDKISSTYFPSSQYYSADNNSWDSTKGFAWDNCPYTSGVYVSTQGEGQKLDVFTKYTTADKSASSGTADGLSSLESADDAATSNWGGSWRMPTGGTNGDFIDLFSACGISNQYTPISYDGTGTESKGVYWCENYSGKKGVLFIAENNAHLFFPAAGQGNGCNLEDTGIKGYYWSKTLTTMSEKAYNLAISNASKGVYVGGNNRCYGWSVRPVSD